MPVYNEATARTFAALEAIRESVEATGLGAALRLFRPLGLDASPTPGSPRSAPSSRLRERLGPGCAALLPAPARRTITARPATSRDFVTRWGGAYEHMLVLDADSLMTGDCIVAARRRDGGRPGRRHHPDAAAHHQPQHPVRPAPAVRRPHLRPGDRHRARRLVGPRRQLLGPQRHHPHARLRGALRPARPARASRPSAATSSATTSSRRR